VHDLELVIFDCDGVLVDSEVISNRVLARALSAEGLPTTLAQSRRAYQGLLLEDIVHRAEAALGRTLPEGWGERFERDREQEFRAALAQVPGAAETVEGLRAAGVAVCVASQGKLEKTRLSLELTGLRQLFADQALFSAYSVPRGKPYPDLFLHAAETMGATPSRCAVVEDTPSGVRGAVAAGMRVFGYAADSDETALRAAGAEIIHSLQELPSLLGLGRSGRRPRTASEQRDGLITPRSRLR
jgi:HAD superfamily hydrolase (TIGR01509 family)